MHWVLSLDTESSTYNIYLYFNQTELINAQRLCCSYEYHTRISGTSMDNQHTNTVDVPQGMQREKYGHFIKPAVPNNVSITFGYKRI